MESKLKEVFDARAEITKKEDDLMALKQDIKKQQGDILEKYPHFKELVEKHNSMQREWETLVSSFSKHVDELIDLGGKDA